MCIAVPWVGRTVGVDRGRTEVAAGSPEERVPCFLTLTERVRGPGAGAPPACRCATVGGDGSLEARCAVPVSTAISWFTRWCLGEWPP